MSDTLKAALIALVGTAILAPLVVRGLAWLAEKRSQLLVVLTWNEAGKSKHLDEIVTKLILESKTFREAPAGDENRWNDLRIFRALFAAQSYMRFIVLNKSKKKISNLTLFDNEWSDIFQVDQGEVKSVERGQPMVLGDLQPGREIILHLWSSSNVPGWNPDSISRFRFSADELDRVKIKEPIQLFRKRRYVQLLLKYFTIGTFVTWIAIALFAYLYGNDVHFSFKWGS